MHILFLPSWYPTEESPINGVFFREQAQALKRAGHRVGVIAFHLRPLKLLAKDIRKLCNDVFTENDKGIPTYRDCGYKWLPYVPRGNAFLWLRSGLRLFDHYISDMGKPDILHAHCALYGGALATRIKDEYGIPYVITEHSTAYARGLILQWEKTFTLEAFRQADARVFVSPSLGRLVEESFGTTVSPWRWIPNFVEPRFSNVLLDNPRKGSQVKFRFLNIALMAEHKGQRDLLVAFAEAFKGNKNTLLHMGGDGPMKHTLLLLADDLGISDQVRFLGMLKRDQVLDAMRRADVFVLSSHYETFGVVFIEALACGKPIIATACGGPECIVNKKNGLLVSPGNVKQLAAAMVQIRHHIAEYDPDYIRYDCLSRFGEEAVVNQLSDLYQEVLSNR